jgi:hypothetical protein
MMADLSATRTTQAEPFKHVLIDHADRFKVRTSDTNGHKIAVKINFTYSMPYHHGDTFRIELRPNHSISQLLLLEILHMTQNT